MEVLISSLYRSLAPYAGEWFEILPHQDPVSLLRLKIRAFDEIDAEAEFLRISSYFLDVLSVETNSLFWLCGQEDLQSITSTMESEQPVCPDVNTFIPDEEWMDGIPHCNGYLIISYQAIQFLDRILSKDELSDEENIFISACHHFHVAREQDALILDRFLDSGEQKDQDEGTASCVQEHSLLKSVSLFSKRAQEIATVMYMSAIEVASTINSSPPQKCSNCGQPQYKISARVIDYVKKYLESAEGDHLSKVFKSHYQKRSKYLHEGVVLSNHHTRKIIPQLDPSSDSGVSQRTHVSLINLREWVGYMLRKQLKSIIGA